MATVVVKNGNVDGALRTFRERQEGYMKPGVRRRKEKKENIKNSRRNQRNEYRRAA